MTLNRRGGVFFGNENHYRERNRVSKKLLNCLSVATLLATILTPVASASVINSSLSGVRMGFSSQRVKRRGSHAVEVGLVACRSNAPAANSKLDIELREHRRFMPDRSEGIRNGKGCFSRPTRVGWGYPGHATYFFKLHTWNWQSTSARNFNMYF